LAVTRYITLFLVLGVIIIWYFTRIPHHGTLAVDVVCMANLRALSLAIDAYSIENNGDICEINKWCDQSAELVDEEKYYTCPLHQNARYSYAINKHLAGHKLKKIRAADRTVFLFESDAGWNGAGGLESLATGRHNTRTVLMSPLSMDMFKGYTFHKPIKKISFGSR